MTPQETLKQFLDDIHPDHPVVMVRWVDEPRIVPEQDTGFTVGHRAYVTLTAKLKGGQTSRETIEALTLYEVKQIIAHYPIRALYRSDNQTR